MPHPSWTPLSCRRRALPLGAPFHDACLESEARILPVRARTGETSQLCTELFCPIYSIGTSPQPALVQAADGPDSRTNASDLYMAGELGWVMFESSCHSGIFGVSWSLQDVELENCAEVLRSPHA